MSITEVKASRTLLNSSNSIKDGSHYRYITDITMYITRYIMDITDINIIMDITRAKVFSF